MSSLTIVTQIMSVTLYVTKWANVRLIQRFANHINISTTAMVESSQLAKISVQES